MPLLTPLRKLRGVQIQRGNRGHVGIIQGKIKDIHVFRDMRFLGGSGDGNNSSLEMPSQAHLRNGLIVLLSDGGKRGIGEKPITAFSKWCPGFHLYAMLL